MLRLKVIIGSTREGRMGEHVMHWLKAGAEAHGGFEVEVLDLRDWPLPIFQETFATIGDLRDPTYSDPIVKRWNTTMKEGEAFIFVTPEYNHSFSGVLKNALDNVFVSQAFRNKPVAFVGYAGTPIGGARAVEQLALVAIEAELVPLRNAVLIGGIREAFDEEGKARNKATDAALTIALDDLQWFGKALAAARAEGQLPPGMARMRSLTAPPA